MVSVTCTTSTRWLGSMRRRSAQEVRLVIVIESAWRTTGPRERSRREGLLRHVVVPTLIAAPVIVRRGGGFAPWMLLLLSSAHVVAVPVMLPVILPVFAALFLAVIIPVAAVATVATARLTCGALRQGAQPADDTRGGDQASLLEPVGLLNFGFRLVHDGLLYLPGRGRELYLPPVPGLDVLLARSLRRVGYPPRSRRGRQPRRNQRSRRLPDHEGT